jgi:uncharacterized membrane protein YedE/YeeE
MSMENFTPITAVIGGLLIGLAASVLLWTNGKISGISGILAGSLFSFTPEGSWRWAFLLGLVGAGVFYPLLAGQAIEIETQAGPLITVLAGFLVGFGTRLGSGCTSGHGICGIARFSLRSIVATAVFVGAGVITVFTVALVGGGGL